MGYNKDTQRLTDLEVGIDIDFSKINAGLADLEKKVGPAASKSGEKFVKGFTNNFRTFERLTSNLSKSFASLANSISRPLTEAFNASGKAAQAFGKVAQQSIKSTERMTTAIARGGGGSGGMMSALRMGTGIGAGMYAFDKIQSGLMAIPKMFWEAVGDASEAEKVERKFKSVFQNLSPEAKRFASGFAQELGRSETEIKNTMNRFQDQFVPQGLSRERSLSLSKKMTRLTADLSASEGISESETADRLVSGLSGNHEALRRFGVMITESSLNAKLLEMGLKGGTKAADEQTKILARLNIVLASTKDAQGMAAKAGGSFAQESRALQGIWTDFSATMGKLFLPALAKVTKFFRDMVANAKMALGDTGKLGESLGLAFERLLKLAEPLKTNVAGFFGELGKKIEKIINYIEKLSQKWGNWNGFVDSMSQAFDDASKRIYETLKEAIKAGIVAGLNESLFGEDKSGKIAYQAWQRFLKSKGKEPGKNWKDLSQEERDNWNKAAKPKTEPPKTSGAFDALKGDGESIDASPPASKEDAPGSLLDKFISGFGSKGKPSPSQWSQMSDAEKRKALIDFDRSQGIKKNWTYEDLSGDALDKHAQRRKRIWGNEGVIANGKSYTNNSTEAKEGRSTLYSMLEPGKVGGDYSQEKLGGGAAGGFLGALNALTNNALGNKTGGLLGSLGAMGMDMLKNAKIQEPEYGSASPARFMGLQDLQKQVQMGVGDEEQKRDRKKIELATKQLEAQQKIATAQAAAAGQFATALGNTLKGYLGLQ